MRLELVDRVNHPHGLGYLRGDLRRAGASDREVRRIVRHLGFGLCGPFGPSGPVSGIGTAPRV